MNGPDHYRRAEQLMATDLVEAHVHALLALAAAIAVKTQPDQEAWIRVAATTPPPPPPPQPPPPRPVDGPRPAWPKGR
jgi:hypothetical protein